MDGLTEDFGTGNIGYLTFDRLTPAFTNPPKRTDALLETTTGRKLWWSLLGCKDVC
jgi:hypothetical protein